ncbi:MAG: transcriptional regulator [Elusimicrobia bacterium HGW-Elusimicrobia-2]|nr:MAG: transcriptional regulator [Elusimicrobia bacterium HGW-Elusimicrobia-2]
MSEFKIITCIVERGKADKIVEKISSSTGYGVTSYYARGTGVREKIGFIGRLIEPEKEVFTTVVPAEKADEVFDKIVELAHLKEPGKGFAFIQDVDRAVGFYQRD